MDWRAGSVSAHFVPWTRHPYRCHCFARGGHRNDQRLDALAPTLNITHERRESAMKYNPLGKTGLNVSRLSLGASSLGGVFHPVDESEAIAAVHAALDCGINYFDVA